MWLDQSDLKKTCRSTNSIFNEGYDNNDNNGDCCVGAVIILIFSIPL